MMGQKWRILTSQDAATAVTISDGTVGVDAVLSRAQAVITNTVLTVRKLAKSTRSTARSVQAEAAAVAPANEGIGTGSKSRDGNEVLHGR